MNFVPDEKKIRLIIDTDAANEADDAYAVAHALLTPKFEIKGIIGAHFGTEKRQDSMLASCEECRKVLTLMGMEKTIALVKGCSQAIRSENHYEYSEGAELIVKEALSDSALPLYVIFLGPLTDLASAYLAHPEIASRLTAIWIGGGRYPEGGTEYNVSNDICAANIIFRSEINLWQVPINAYTEMRVSLTELEEKVSHCGDIGAYLFGAMVDLNLKLAKQSFWPFGESWSLGDSPAVGLLLDAMEFYSTMREAPVVNQDMSYRFSGSGRKIRVYDRIDSRFILEDFYAKLRKFAGKKHSDGGV